MNELADLFENNRRWAESLMANDPEFFLKLSRQQTPKYLWIGCSDSRVPANQLLGLLPGEVFVHRNISNVVQADDLNATAVIQYAVDILKVEHVIVCGHYGCGGVQAALENRSVGLCDQWISHVQRVRDKHPEELNSLDSKSARFRRLCELNVREQVLNLSQISVIQEAWRRNQKLALHGWIYAIENGLLRDLKITKQSPADH